MSSGDSDGRGDYRPVIVVLVFIVLLTAATLLFARCCVGRQAFMRTGYDVEGYVIRRFGVCVGSGIPTCRHTTVQVDDAVEEVEPSSQSQPPAAAATVEVAAGAAAAAAAATTAATAAAAAATAAATTATATAQEEEDDSDDDENEEEEEEELHEVGHALDP